MSDDSLSRIHARRREAFLALANRVAGLEGQMQWVLWRLGPGTPPIPNSPPSSSSPTATPSVIRSALSKMAEKLGREALTQFALWLAALAFKWLGWVLAGWTMGGAVMRFLERWAAFFLG